MTMAVLYGLGAVLVQMTYDKCGMGEQYEGCVRVSISGETCRLAVKIYAAAGRDAREFPYHD